MKVPLVDLRAQLAELRPRVDAALAGVLDRCSFVLGPDVEEFERVFADRVGVRHAVGVNSGTDALVLALEAVRRDRGPGRVVTTPFTFFATVEACLLAGPEPVFCDIEAGSF
ncbi:MAG: DegT/DnrJ/EryC1/StrS family aminotransferase, partial [Planctomycetota bacterium]